MTTPEQNALSKTLSNIRRYTEEHTELQKSHHFCFNLPLDKESTKADVIVIGLNPGEADKDWDSDVTTPTEETNEFDFHEASGQGRSSVRWSQLCNQYLSDSRVVISEFFFWSSGNLKKEFNERFGYSFKKCPHFDFCKDCNLELLRFHQPKLIVGTGTSWAEFFAEKYDLKHIKTVESANDKRHRKIIIHYEWENVPFIFTPHWSSGYVSNDEKTEIISYLSSYI